jgi:hypothetical protein
MAEPTRPARKKPTTAGKAGRWIAAGGAVGASLALVGAMSAAANTAADTGSETGNNAASETRQVVVVPQAEAPPTQIVVVLPGATGDVATLGAVTGMPTVPDVSTAPLGSTGAAAPPAPVAPAPAPVAAPVTESSGS